MMKKTPKIIEKVQDGLGMYMLNEYNKTSQLKSTTSSLVRLQFNHPKFVHSTYTIN